PQLSYEEGRQALRRLIHQHDVGVADERPAAREHGLLATGELASTMLQPFAQAREELEHPREVPAVTVAAAIAHRQALTHVQRREHAPALWDQADAAASDLVSGQPADVRPPQHAPPATPAGQAPHRAAE